MPSEKLSSINPQSSFLTKAGAYAPLIILFCSVVLIGSLSRLMLVLWQLDRVWETGILPTVFLQGLRVDLILAGMAVAPLLLVLPVLGPAHRDPTHAGFLAQRAFNRARTQRAVQSTDMSLDPLNVGVRRGFQTPGLGIVVSGCHCRIHDASP